MSDIFEIKGVNAALKVGDKLYRFADPLFPEKVKLQKEMRALANSPLDTDDYSLAIYEINKRMIKQYLPEIEQEVLDGLGEFKMLAVLDSIRQLSKDNFGAVVARVEEKK